MPLQVVAVLKVRPEAVEVARPIIMELIQHTRKEPGVIKYDWYHDHSEPNTFVVLETYENLEALQAHEKSEHFQKVILSAKEWLAAPLEARILTPEYVKQ